MLLESAPKLTDGLKADQIEVATGYLDHLAPLSSDDIRALISLLPAEGDTAFGLNWTILHAIEAAPAWPLWDTLEADGHEWIRIFRDRLANAGLHPPENVREPSP
jgi:hypothetical protein